jgi:hypothetical protein
VTDRNDFDIFDEPPPSQPQRVHFLWWATAIALVAFVGFAGGMAFFTLNQRLPSPTATPLPPVTPGAAVAEAIATIAQGLGAPATGAITPTAQGGQTTPTAATNAPTATTNAPAPTTAMLVTPTATLFLTQCTQPFDSAFATITNSDELGCPLAPANVVWAAIETFEQGAMVWRSDNNTAYTLIGTDVSGEWSQVMQNWNGEALPSRGAPPPGRFAPERGFGFAWGTDDQIFRRLGWATAPELGFCIRLQVFERGFVLQSNRAESCTPDRLFNQARNPQWTPFTLLLRNQTATDGMWRTAPYIEATSGQPATVPTQASGGQAPDPTATPAVPTPTPVATATQAPIGRSRPADNGNFFARRGIPVALDGRLEDWSNNWLPLVSIVQGGENFGSLQDLGGSFQIMWSADGLYVAIRVGDDVYRSGPEGTDMWKGDGLEIQFDRDLAGDFDNAKANGDDFQLGISFGPDLNQVRGYRWLPYSLESSFAGNGAVVRTASGYNVELLLPWSLFELSGSGLTPGQSFGFNLSVNDNDGDTPAQQSVLSASPARTTHDNPSEWSTLVLGG